MQRQSAVRDLRACDRLDERHVAAADVQTASAAPGYERLDVKRDALRERDERLIGQNVASLRHLVLDVATSMPPRSRRELRRPGGAARFKDLELPVGFSFGTGKPHVAVTPVRCRARLRPAGAVGRERGGMECRQERNAAGRLRFVQSLARHALAAHRAAHRVARTPGPRARPGHRLRRHGARRGNPEARSSRTADWSCIDVHPVPREQRATTRAGASTANSTAVPSHSATAEFDVALLCDVLHDAPEDAAGLLAEAGRVARHVLVERPLHAERGVRGERLATEQRARHHGCSTPGLEDDLTRALTRRRPGCFARTGSSSPCCAAS